MKRLVYLILLVIALTLLPVISYADVNYNYISCTIAASDTLADAGEGETFDCTKVANSATLTAGSCTDTTTGLCRLSIISSSCANYTSCATSEIVTVKTVAVAGDTYTFTIKARDQETSLGGRTHSGVWDTGSQVQLLMTAQQIADLKTAIDLIPAIDGFVECNGTTCSAATTMSIASIDMSSGTSSIPWIVGTSTWPTAEGSAKWDSANDILYVGDGVASQKIYPTTSIPLLVETYTGDVVGPSSSTDNAITRFNSTTGKLVQDYTSGAPTIGDTGAVDFQTTLTLVPTTSSTTGVILKSTDPFIHDYTETGTDGHNTFLGISAGNFTLAGTGTEASDNTGVGYHSLDAITTGSGNTAVGSNALTSLTTATGNIAIGKGALENNTTGSNNIAIGNSTLNTVTTGVIDSIAIGTQALISATTGDDNFTLGHNALAVLTTGSQNVAIGFSAMLNNNGTGNVAIGGSNALYTNASGNYNVAIGEQSLRYTDASNNVAVGYKTGWSGGANTIANNVIVGYQSGYSLLTGGDDNTLLGYQAGATLTTGSNNIIIGSGIDADSVTGDNQLNIGGAIKGNLSTKTISLDGHFLFTTDNTYDIGASGATRPRTGYFGTSVIAPNFTGLASTATALAADPTDCGAGVVATAIAANGNLTCSIDPIVSTEIDTFSELDTIVADKILASSDSTNTFTNKTFAASATGNVLKQTGYILLISPHRFDGTGAVFQTTLSAAYFGQANFSNSADLASNWVEYRLQVPADIDTTVDLTAAFKFRLGGADTGTHRYVISSVSVADSASYDSPTLASAINLDFAGDGSGADGDVESIAATTLTGWKAALTAGQLWVIRLARDGNATEDASTVNSYSGALVISYGKTQ